MMTDIDLFVIGGGSGGVRAARVAASLGARVVLAEESKLGGTCVNLGCIPKKILVHAASFDEARNLASGHGWTIPQAEHDWQRLIAAKDQEIARLNGVYERLLADAGVHRIHGRALICAPGKISVNGELFSAHHILIATGSQPLRLDIAGADLSIVSDDAFSLSHKPKRILIVGGGYIATEFACIFNGLGSDVIQIHRGDLLLNGFDDDLRAALAETMQARGIDLRFNRELTRLEAQDQGISCQLNDRNNLTVDLVLLAIGRRPRALPVQDSSTMHLACDNRGAIIVDQCFETSIKGIWAVGDIIGRSQLTPVAIAQGQALARYLFGNEPVTLDESTVPTAIFSSPPLACVGLSEAEAREQELNIRTYISRFVPLADKVAGSQVRNVIKLVTDQGGRILGAHMMGSYAAEILQSLAIAINMGATKADLDSTLSIHPTSAEEFISLS